MNAAVLRAKLLIGQSRWELAQNELRHALTEDVQNAEAHSLLGLCLAQLEKYAEAEEEARSAVGLAPDDAHCHAILAMVLADRRKYADAAEAAEQAAALDPSEPEIFATLAQIRHAQEDWPGMLEAAETGLALDPENVRCNNLRAMALVKLGRKAEAGQTLDAALARQPDNAFTHANRGWALLESGKQNEALDHFREALSFDPTMEWSRAGIVEALKAKNIVYRWLLRYFLWMAKLSPRARWGFVIGAFLLQRLLASYVQEHPGSGPFLLPIVYTYCVFALLTWLSQPLFNLLLFTDKLGRRALTSDQKIQAFAVAGVLIVAIGIAVTTPFVGTADLRQLGYESAFYLGLVSLPTSAITFCQRGWPRWTMVAATVGLAAMALVPLVAWIYLDIRPEALLEHGRPWFVDPLLFVRDNFWLGIIGSQFLAMYLSRIRLVR